MQTNSASGLLEKLFKRSIEQFTRALGSNEYFEMHVPSINTLPACGGITANIFQIINNLAVDASV